MTARSISRSVVSPLARSIVGGLLSLSELQSLINDLFGAGQQGLLLVPKPLVDGVQVLFQDAAGTTPVTADGDPVGLMLDLSPNGNDATQSTSAARPLYRTDGTLHWLEFDGVDDGLFISESLSLGASAFSLSVAEQTPGVSVNPIIAPGTTNTGAGWQLTSEIAVRVTGGNKLFSSASTLSREVLTTTFPSGDVISTQAYLNGSQLSEDTSISQSVDIDSGGAVGARVASGGGSLESYAECDIYGVVLVSTNLDDSQRARVESYLATLAGVTL